MADEIPAVDPAATPAPAAAAPAAGTAITDPAAPAAGTAITDPAGAAPKPAETVKAAAPEKYEDFKLPEGVKVDAATLAEFQSVAKELNLTQEQAQKVVDLQGKLMTSTAKDAETKWEALKETWRKTGRTDAEIGGDKFDSATAAARVALSKFGSPGLVDVLNETGLGDHPEIIRAFSKIGKAIKDDALVVGGSKSEAPKDHASRLFPDLA